MAPTKKTKTEKKETKAPKIPAKTKKTETKTKADSSKGESKAKRTLSAYNLYMQKNLPLVKKENPSLSHTEAFKKTAENYSKEKKTK